jgi:pimeloyl-ACP methyl ester carboxylesterase
MELFYRHFGNGYPTVILHGLFGISDNWVTFGRELSSHFSVYLPDLRNHGQSPHSSIFDFPALGSDILEFCETHQLNQINLIGHSLGGKTAMLLALQHPELVSKLVVVDISLRKSPPDRDHQKLLDAMFAVDFSSAASRSDVERQLSGAIPSARIRQFLLKNVYWRDRHVLDWRLNLKGINENLLLVFESIDFPGQFIRPSLFIRGGASDYILDSDIPMIKSKFPGATVETIEKASHWVHADAPGEFYRLVSEFLLKAD